MNERVLVEEAVVFGLHQRRGDGVDPAAQALARDQHVRLDAVVLVTPHATGASETGLHLVDDQERAALATQPLDALEIALGRKRHTQGRGNGFEDHRRRSVIDGRIHGRELAERDLTKIRKIGPNAARYCASPVASARPVWP